LEGDLGKRGWEGDLGKRGLEGKDLGERVGGRFRKKGFGGKRFRKKRGEGEDA